MKKFTDLKLSIIIACHSSNGYLAETLDSILNCGWNFHGMEILICDDASPENNGDGRIAREYARRHPELIRVIRNDVPLRGALTHARLVNEARGEYFMVFDSDDVLLPFDIQSDLDFLDAHPEYCATNGKKRLFDREHGDSGESHGGPFSYFLLTFSPCVCHNGMVMRRSDVLEAGNYRELGNGKDSVAFDVFLWMRLALRKKILFVNSYRALYRCHDSQNSRERRNFYISDYQYMRQYLIDQDPKLYQALEHRKMLTVDDSNRIRVQIYLGLLFYLASDTGQVEAARSFAANAVQVDPFDYGARDYYARTLLMENQISEAQNQSTLLLLLFPDDDYIRIQAIRLLKEIARKNHFEVQIYDQMYNLSIQKFFHMTELEQTLFQKTIDNQKRYEK